MTAIATAWCDTLQQVVKPAKLTGREQMFTVPIVGKGARLPHQPVNDVAVVDPIVGAPAQSWQLLHLLPPKADFNPFRKHPCFDQFANQTAVQGVAVALDRDQ